MENFKPVKLVKTSDVHEGHTNNTIKIHEKFFAKLAEEYAKPDGPDALILAGDLVSHKQKSLKVLFRLLRNALPHIPVIACFGNHDWWDEGKYVGGKGHRKYSYKDLVAMHDEALGEYNIHYVGNGPYVIRDVAIVGFDGWYWHLDPPTNDKAWMDWQWEGMDPFAFMNRKAFFEFDALMQMDTSPYRAVVGVTHFPPFTDQERYYIYCANRNLLPLMTEKWDVLCVGHSHKFCDFEENGCRVINAGSDYDNPNYVVFEV